MTTWNGKETVDSAITKIQQQAYDMGIYETNETELVKKINDLKAVRDDLQGQVNNLTAEGITDDQTIATLKEQIKDLEVQISSLETDIATANSNSEILADRIAALEAQL